MALSNAALGFRPEHVLLMKTSLPESGPEGQATMEASLYEETAAPRFRTLVLSIFAGLALCLAIAGIYGVTAYVVGQKSNEIGLRMAMGATPRQVLGLILRNGMGLAAIGMAIGLFAFTGWNAFDVQHAV